MNVILLKLTLIEFILRILPESFLLLLGNYLFCNKRINTKIYMESSIFLAITSYFIRLLPIDYGVHSIINIIMIICTLVKFNKFPIMKSISSTFIFIILLSFCELINIFVIEKILKLNIKLLFNSTFNRIVYMSPSLFLFAFIIFLFYIIKIAPKKLKHCK